MLNRVILIGRLVRDPDQSFTQSGVARTKFTLAIERNYAGADGKRQADFIDVVAWRALAENCSKYLRKGLMTAVSGRLEIRSYDGQDGQKRRIAEVVADEVRFLEWPKDGGQAQGDMQDIADQFGGKVLDDNELPFN